MSAPSFDARRALDLTVMDPPFLDPDYPPEQFVVHFKSGGATVHATVWQPDGPALKPCVILSPQLFGGDRLESLIIPLVNAGIAVLTFHPRGMWDGTGTYSFLSALEDIKSAVDFVAGAGVSEVRSPGGRSCRFDAERIAVAGLSGGGGSLGIAACSEDSRIGAVVAIAPGNFEINREPADRATAGAFLAYLREVSDGRIDLANWLDALSPADFDRISPVVRAPHLFDKKVLLVGATRDTSTPLETNHRPIAAAFRAAGVAGFSEVILEADHAFLTKRIALASIIIAWLRGECGF